MRSCLFLLSDHEHDILDVSVNKMTTKEICKPTQKAMFVKLNHISLPQPPQQQGLAKCFLARIVEFAARQGGERGSRVCARSI